MLIYRPGISAFSQNPEKLGPEHLRPLLDHALSVVPADAVKDTPIFLLATAGMRLLANTEQQNVLNNICSYIKDTTNFLLPDCSQHVQVIDGQTEGLYGWIATNYLLGGLDDPKAHDHGKGHHTYGFLDMGGASAQLAFAPNSTEAEKHANDLTLLRLRGIDGKPFDFKVFVTSWLGFGVREARNRYVDALLRGIDYKDTAEILDPCLPAGLRTAVDGRILPDSPIPEESPSLLGSGRFDECLRQTFPLLDKDAPCEDEPCLVHGVHVPAIDFDVNHFIGISEYWHTTHEVFEMGHKDKAYDFNTYQQRVKKFCSQDWVDIELGVSTQKWGKKVDLEKAYEVCFKASWLINMLHNGIGIPRVGLENTKGADVNGTEEAYEKMKEKGFLDPFQAVNKIDTTEVSWTLGKAVLYSASQVPPAEKSLPVGFGSNVPGIPEDFHYAGPELLPAPGSAKDGIQNLKDHWHETLLNGDHPRRIPGVFLIIFIVLVALFFLCGRDRRRRIYRKLSLANNRHGGNYRRRGGGFFSGKIPFFGRRNHSSYERVLEEGAPDFELGGVDSDDETSHRPSRPGVPKRLSSTGHRFNYDLGNGSSQSIHSNVDRSGLVVRTESRERLSPIVLGATNNGRKSRTTSPVRQKSPLVTPVHDE